LRLVISPHLSLRNSAKITSLFAQQILPEMKLKLLTSLCLLLGYFTGFVSAKPLQVYILAGQSNMQGHAKLSTIQHLGMDAASKPMLDLMTSADGKPRTCERVWISYIGGGGDESEERTGKLTAGFGANPEKLGPEFTFGLTMEKATDGPILLIKTAWGGKSLNTDFRSPAAGPYVFNQAQLDNAQSQKKDLSAIKADKEKATGVYYRKMLEHVQKVLADPKRVVPSYDPAQGYELAGFAWFQGWNDLVDSSTYPQRNQPNGYEAYSVAMAHFIRDLRKDLKSPQLPFVIGVLGVGGPTALYGPEEARYRLEHQHFRDAMAAPASLPEFKGNVIAVRTEIYWDRELGAARNKDSRVRQAQKKIAKERNLTPAEEKTLADQAVQTELTERERELIQKGISNAEFHYLGSAKILGGVGQGLAEGLLELRKGSAKSKP
jgi:hypothetical protein